MATTNLQIVIKTVDESTAQLNSIESSISKLAKTAVSMYALKEVFDFLKDSINKAGQEEQQLRTLQTVIENQGESWNNVSGAINNYIITAEHNSMFTSAQLIPAMTQLANVGMNSAQSMQAMTQVMDLATVKGISLETSANLIAKAYNGNLTMLTRYGIVATDFNDLMGQINNKFGGATQKDMETYAGNVKKLEQTIDDNQKMIGNYWIPSLIEAAKWLDKIFGIDRDTESPAQHRIAQITAELKFFTDASVKYQNDHAEAIQKVRDKLTAEFMDIERNQDAYNKKFTNPTVGYDPKKSQTEQKQNETEYIDSLKKQYEATVQIRNATDQIMMNSFDYEMQLIDQKAEAYQFLGVKEVDINNWVTAEKIKALDKEFNLKKTTEQIVDTLAIGSAENKKYLIADILEAETLAASKKFAWMAIEHLLMLDFAGAAKAGAEALALGYAASVIHAETDLDKSRNAQNNATASTTSTASVVTSNGQVIQSAPSSIASQSAPTYYYITNSYNLNAGVMLGSQDSIDNAFKQLMIRYDQYTTLVRSS